MERDTTWRRRLDTRAVEGLLTAVEQAVRSGKSFLEMTADDFPLNGPAREAIRTAFDLAQGRWGLCLLQGFPVRRWSEDEVRLAHWGIGLHVGVARPQNRASEIMNDVRNEGGAYLVPGGRGYNTNASLDFHIDFCDVVALLCRRTAKSGGTRLVSSSLAVVDEIRRAYPHLAAALHQPIPFSWQGTQAPGQSPTYLSPLCDEKDGVLAFRTNRKNIDAAQRDFIDAPRLTVAQQELVGAVDRLLADDRFCYSMRLEEGDLQLVNNYVIVHSRTRFEDRPEADEKRHLLRLWLAVPGSQALPDSWLDAFKDTRAGSVRGGTRGSRITPEYLRYESRQARRLGMPNVFGGVDGAVGMA